MSESTYISERKWFTIVVNSIIKSFLLFG